MALSNNNGANSGEVLRAATQIVPNDFESVYNAFYYLAEHIHDIAESVNVTKDPVGARDAYFRAATYVSVLSKMVHNKATDGFPSIVPQISSIREIGVILEVSIWMVTDSV